MGIIRAAFSSVTGALSDQFLEAIEPEGMGEQTVFVRGVLKNRKNGKTGSAKRRKRRCTADEPSMGRHRLRH